MHVIISVLAGQGVARLLETFGVGDIAVSVLAVLSTAVFTIMLLIWREYRNGQTF